MTTLLRALLLCLAVFTLGPSLGVAQIEPPVGDEDLPEGAIASDGAFYFKGNLMAGEPLQSLMFVIYEMEDDDVAEEFYDDAVDEMRSDDTSRESSESLRNRNDRQILVNAVTDDDAVSSFIMFQADEYFGIWMAIDVDNQDEVLAELYGDFYRDGFDVENPFPGPEDVPEGFELW